VYFDCVAYNQNNEVVIVGEAEMMPVKDWYYENIY
jgi:hypothetical protein